MTNFVEEDSTTILWAGELLFCPATGHVTLSYERGCQEKKLPRGRIQRIFLTSSPDFLNVRARSASLFLRVVFSRNPAARTARSSEFLLLPVVSFHYHDGANRFHETDKLSLLLSYIGGNAWSYLRLVAYGFLRMSGGA